MTLIFVVTIWKLFWRLPIDQFSQCEVLLQAVNGRSLRPHHLVTETSFSHRGTSTDAILVCINVQKVFKIILTFVHKNNVCNISSDKNLDISLVWSEAWNFEVLPPEGKICKGLKTVKNGFQLRGDTWISSLFAQHYIVPTHPNTIHPRFLFSIRPFSILTKKSIDATKFLF